MAVVVYPELEKTKHEHANEILRVKNKVCAVELRNKVDRITTERDHRYQSLYDRKRDEQDFLARIRRCKSDRDPLSLKYMIFSFD